MEKLWLRPSSLFILLVFDILCVIPFIPTDTSPSKLPLILAFIAYTILNIFYIYFVVKKYKLPKAKLGELAILFYIDADNDNLMILRTE